MASLSLRKRSRESEPEDTGSAVDVIETDARGRTTAGKGKPTPKRSAARAARTTGGTFGPAATSKEARARDRDERRRLASEQRAALRSGDLSKMPARERAPERVIARDIVDSRINAGTLFLPVVAIYFVGGVVPNSTIRQSVSLLMLLGIIAVIVDGFLLGRKVQRAVAERYPDSRVKVRMYAAQRSLVPRRWRMPPPRVTRGK